MTPEARAAYRGSLYAEQLREYLFFSVSVPISVNMNAKAKGTRAEHRSIRLLEAAGYACTRAAASLGAWDIIGVGSTDFALVQVKTRDWPGSAGD
jgi:hypothetical protein